MFSVITAILITAALFVAFSMVKTGGGMRFRFRKRSFFAFFALLTIVPSFFAQVSANEVGIVYDPFQGGIQDIALGEGLHIVTPFQKVYMISTKLREDSFNVSAQTGKIIKVVDGVTEETGGGQWATYSVTIQYRVEVANAQTFFRNFGGDSVSKSTIEARIRESLQNNSVDFDIFSILKGSLNDVRNSTELELIDSLGELGISIQAFIILDVDAGAVIEAVVEQEATAAKQIEIALKDQEADLIRVETLKLKSEIEAETVVILANAQAEADRVLNSVTANAIYTMYEGQFLDEQGVVDQTLKDNFELDGSGGYLTISEISEIVLTQLYYDAWDGVLPTVVAGDGTDLIVSP
ncbi:MAG: hypothetical protein JXR62_00210 [Bacilli bacterium]|nr:hypothetical protein [Bacilli bacterium]